MKLQRWFGPAGRLVRSCGVGLALLCVATLAQAQNTVQNFSAIFPPGAGQPPAILPDSNNVDWPPLVVDGWDGNALRITHDGVGSLNAGIAFNQVVSGPYSTLEFDFDFQITDAVGGEKTNGADGIGFAYAASDSYGANNLSAVPGFSEEPNLAGSLGVGFDSWSNQDPDGTPNGTLPDSVSLHWDGALVESIPVGDLGVADNWIEDANVKHATISVTGDGKVSVTVTDLNTGDVIKPWTNFQLDGFTPYNGRVAFRSRTGGENANHDIDNVVLTHTPQGGPANQVVLSNFNDFEVDEPLPLPDPGDPPVLVGGTPFTSYQAGSAPGPALIPDSPTGGAGPGHLQLTKATGSQLNSIAFDKTSSVADNIQASFKFRIDNSGNNADGMSFLVLDANQYGDDGELTEGFSEEPNLTAALGIAFDTFDNDEEGVDGDPNGCGGGGACTDRRANHVSLHWDGAKVGENVLFDPAQFDLVNNAWNEVSVLATQTDDGVVVTMTITDGTDSSVEVPFVDVLIPGAEFPNGARAAFGGRTGGAWSVQSIDDVLISWTGGGLLPGDFNGNGMLDSGDIDDLTMQSAGGTNPPAYDLNGDNLVNGDDVNFWIGDLFKSYSGDLNLDKEFSSADLVDMLAAGLYETGQPSKWSSGDFNGDGVTNSGDLVTALAGGGYEQGPMQAVASVPEPAGITLLLLGSLLLIRRRGK